MTHQATRIALRNTFGAREYRITRSGEIHIFGVMPNPNTTGWYLYGYVGSAEIQRRLGLGKDS